MANPAFLLASFLPFAISPAASTPDAARTIALAAHREIKFAIFTLIFYFSTASLRLSGIILSISMAKLRLFDRGWFLNLYHQIIVPLAVDHKMSHCAFQEGFNKIVIDVGIESRLFERVDRPTRCAVTYKYAGFRCLKPLNTFFTGRYKRQLTTTQSSGGSMKIYVVFHRAGFRVNQRQFNIDIFMNDNHRAGNRSIKRRCSDFSAIVI